MLEICQEYGWKYILTLKEGRQPTTWEEMLKLLPRSRANVVRTGSGTPPMPEPGWTFAGSNRSCWASTKPTSFWPAKSLRKAATLYGYITNFSNLTPQRVIVIAGTGRQRHRIEDKFNAEKNHGIGLEHVFCAETTASKNYYTMMQAAQILWTLVSHGYCKRLYPWAKDATDQGLALAAWEGWQFCRWPPDLPATGTNPLRLHVAPRRRGLPTRSREPPAHPSYPARTQFHPLIPARQGKPPPSDPPQPITTA